MGFIDRADKTTVDQAKYYAHEISQDLHNRERWGGISGDQSGNNWLTVDGITSFQCISGNNDFGADANDEAKLVGSTDTPIISGNTSFDIHRILVTSSSSTTPYIIRIIYGTGTMAAEEAAGNYTETVYMRESVVGRARPMDIKMPEIDIGSKVWAKCKNATDNATIDFLIGIHEYSY